MLRRVQARMGKAARQSIQKTAQGGSCFGKSDLTGAIARGIIDMVLLVCDATDTHRGPGLKRPGFF